MSRDTSLQGPTGILIGGRVVLATVFLGTSQIIGSQLGTRPWLLTAWIVALYGATVVYALLFPQFGGSRLFSLLQLIVDVAAASVLVAITGGARSWFSLTYLFIVIAAVILLGRSAGFLVAVLSVVSYAAVLNFQYQGMLGLILPAGLEFPDLLYNTFIHSVGFLLCAALTGYLSEKLKKTVQTLEEREMNLSDLQVFSRDVLENTPVGLVTASTDGTVVMCNPAAASTCFCRREDMMGKMLTEVFPFLSSWQAWTTRAEAELEIRGERRTLGFGLTPLKDRMGKTTGSILIFRDLTDIKAMEEEVRRKQELAAVGELSASIAHELRNPLASLKNSIEIIREEGADGKHNERLMNIAVQEMDRLNAIITDFLAYARPQEPEKHRCDLARVVKDTLTLVEHPEGIAVEDRTTSPLFAEADPSQMRQVVWNLVLNAIEAMGDVGTVCVEGRETGDRVELVFRDTGPGIPDGEKEKVFFPFYSTKERGTGLGLAVTYRIIDAHGGSILLRDAEGQGAEFVIRLRRYGAKNTGR